MINDNTSEPSKLRMITFFLGIRSAIAPPTIDMIIMGAEPTSAVTPSIAGEPVRRYISKGPVIICMDREANWVREPSIYTR